MGNKVIFYGGLALFNLFFYFMDGWKPFAVMLTVFGLLILATEPFRIKNKAIANKIKENAEKLKVYDSEFEADNFFSTYKTKIAFNENASILKVYEIIENDEIKECIIPFSELIESEIVLDNQVVSKVSKSGVAIGGIMAGGIGAIIGGLSASSKQTDMVKSITLKLTAENLMNPVHYIHFLPSREDAGYNIDGYKKDSNIIQTALQNAEYWQGVMDVIIKKSNKVAQ
ncbi:immunity protein [Bacillus atrophaeus]|uniref:immunity protein n=1 Tax=Bacillus atrophaeus TaxID=1452 RepID=UPI000D02E509|nr:immunity protein [Bacillus atrophaeus]PRR94575.1 immunity protein [Bacillus atrophaeus]